MHRLLRRLLKKSGLDAREVPKPQEWRDFIDRLDDIFVSSDEDRYLLERSLEISSREMQELLESSRENYQRLIALIQAIPDPIFYIDEAGYCLDVLSRGCEDFFSMREDEIIGRKIADIVPSRYGKLFLDTIQRAIGENGLKVMEYTMEVQGQRRNFEVRIMPTNLMEKGRRTAIAIIRDTTAQKRSIEYLSLIKKIFEDATEGILISSLDGSYTQANAAFYKMFGSENLPLNDLKSYRRYFEKRAWVTLIKALKEKRNFRGEITIHRDDGSKKLAWVTVDIIDNELGEPTHGVAMITDLSALEESREQLRFIATHDALTGLPNRLFLLEELKTAIARTERSGRRGALLFIDLDNFKEVNDTAGHKIGDMVLKECMQRIRKSIRSSDILGRLGGDEFLLIMENLENVDAPIHVARKIIEVINHPFRIEGEWYELGVSIGIALFPYEGVNVETLLQRADMAMYQAKQEGKNRVRYYSNRVNEQIKRRHRIEQILKIALRDQSFHLVYQPQVDLHSGEIIGLEALLRLEDPETGPISPAEFIPVAEESNLIIHIGRWVFKECCRQLKEWKEAEGEGFTLAINVSRRQLMDKTLVDFIDETIKEYDVNPKRIELEITETTFMQSQEDGNRAIKALQDAGFVFSIDDFGTGYSSLANLKHFVFNRLKIDKSFVDDVLVNDSDRAIIQASVALAHALGMRVIAEGVETQAQRDLMATMGCDEMQGFLFSRPLPPDKIAAMLHK